MSNLIRWYKRSAPLFQVGGFIIVCAFIAGSYYHKYDHYQDILADYGTRIVSLEGKADKTNQKLDDMITFFGVPHKP